MAPRNGRPNFRVESCAVALCEQTPNEKLKPQLKKVEFWAFGLNLTLA
jgi:hypothetical protein